MICFKPEKASNSAMEKDDAKLRAPPLRRPASHTNEGKIKNMRKDFGWLWKEFKVLNALYNKFSSFYDTQGTAVFDIKCVLGRLATIVVTGGLSAKN